MMKLIVSMFVEKSLGVMLAILVTMIFAKMM